MKRHSIRLLFVIIALALAALIVADLVREARGRRLRETILAALQPVAFAPVAAIHDVLDRAGILDSQLAGQHARVAPAASVAIIKNRPLHPLKGCVRFKSLEDLALDVVGRTVARVRGGAHGLLPGGENAHGQGP